MTPSFAVFTYIIVWWLVWMAALPFGVKPVDKPAPMHDPGAPDNQRLGLKVAATSLVSVLIVAVLAWCISDGVVPLHDMQ
jgi:predicted secreted protein